MSTGNGKTMSMMQYVISMFKKLDTNDRETSNSEPAAPVLNNLNAVLADIYARYVLLKKEDRELYYKVFTGTYFILHDLMKKVDPYFARYSSAVKFAGSHYDRLRISKPSEYDLVVGIKVPVNMDDRGAASDIVIEPSHPGYVQLRAGIQYQKLLVRDGVDCLVNRTAHHWLDDKNYIRRSEFASWFEGVIVKAVSRLPRHRNRPSVEIDGVLYTVRSTKSGPAFMLTIEDEKGFKLDVDVVPALIFPESRWPVEGCKAIPRGCQAGTWIVVSKQNKHGNNVHDANRSWRIGLQEQERKMMHNSQHLRITIKLLKKLRDARGMTKIASYYIKTLFLWEVEQNNDPGFWSKNDLATLFKHMLTKFHAALKAGRISYFWNKRFNLIGHVGPQVLDSYARDVNNLLCKLGEYRGHESVAKYLLTNQEYQSYETVILNSCKLKL